MKKMTIFIACLLLAGTLFVVVPETVCGDWDPAGYIYTVSGGKATITGYNGTGGAISIPSTLGGYPTTVIGDYAFDSKTSLTSVIIPDSVTDIGDFAFHSCTYLTSVTIGRGFNIGYTNCFNYCIRLRTINFLQDDMPFDVCSCWVEYAPADLRAHAYSDSDISFYYQPGEYWPDANLTMGEYLDSLSNNPPIFSPPSPGNGTTGNLLSLSWSIPINDPEGDRFSWTIQCSNGQDKSGTNDNNGTKTLTLSDLAYSTVYTVWVNATDATGSGLYTRRWYRFTTIGNTNNPPVFGTPSPGNGSTANPLSFSWNIPINDLEGDTFSWTIQCSNGQENSGTGASNGTKSLTLTGLTYSEGYTIWANTTDPTGSGLYTYKWFTFRTKAYTPPPPPPPPENKKPVADLSAGEPYQGLVNTAITFNGSKSSDSDGNLVSWSWNFGDGTISSGKITTHVYTTAGTYQVTLTVTDDDGANNTDTSTALIKVNTPPTQPTINGPIFGHKNILYNFTVISSDVENDTIRYSIGWGDGISNVNTSAFLPNNTQFTCGHHWIVPGIYNISVKAFDNRTNSTAAYHVILIDVEYVKDRGYLINLTGTNDYEKFYSNATMVESNVQKLANGSYLIDNDGNGTWDYTYNPILKELAPYQPPDTPWFESIYVIGIIVTILICSIIAIVLFRKKE